MNPLMPNRKSRLGLFLPNQAVAFGATTVPELLELADEAERSGAFDGVYAADNLLAKPRLEAITLLAALAGRTRRVRLGTACMASFPLRNPIVLAAQWAALDCIAGGRTVLGACIGGGGSVANIPGAFRSEYEAMGIDPRERAARLEEGIQVLRTLWTHDPASHEGKFFRFKDIAVRPRPVQKPCPPIWIANNPHVFRVTRADILHKINDRVGRLADGWMTAGCTPPQFADSWKQIRERAQAHGRDAGRMECALCYNLNIADDRQKAFAEAKRFLSEYFGSDFPDSQVNVWAAYGSPAECAGKMREFAAAGVQHMIVRFLSYGQQSQLRRFLAEVAPLL
jgi:alkanesulfonate monooxygenase SsuD/methylene tetrahydromethanopterin reductase-like flavin-dependent oxidoreductase (luciferase family)